MAPTQRLFDSGTRRAERALGELGEECRHARLRLGLSQREVAAAARLERSSYSRLESGRLRALSVLAASRAASVLGLNLSIRAYPGGMSIRDAGQAPRLAWLTSCIGRPLTYRLDAPLPPAPDRLEQRAWDLLITGTGERTAAEFEARLYDIQAQTRRWWLKRRDDPVDHFLLVVADTAANRRVLAEFAHLFVELPRLRTDAVVKLLMAGRHPPTGIVLLRAARIGAGSSGCAPRSPLGTRLPSDRRFERPSDGSAKAS
jgi:transcriptional regulator with XRE-family HTH domain